MEVAFVFLAVYLMPVLGFVFILMLLDAVKKIVKGRRYGAQAFWSAFFFAIIVWTIAFVGYLQ